MESINKKKPLFSGKKSVPVSVRARRLLQFLRKYNDLWYENGRSLEEKISQISSDKKEQAEIMALYEEALEDYDTLRMVRSRKQSYEKGRTKDPGYSISNKELDKLRQAGIGRSFGLSDKNQAEYDRLIAAGVDESVVQFIFKKFSSYEKFKQIFCEAMKRGKVQELFAKCQQAKALYIADVDLSSPGGIRTTDRNYVEFLRTILGVDYFIFNGTNLVERLEEFIDDKSSRIARPLGEKGKRVIHGVFGLGEEKKTAEQMKRELGVSSERVRQLLVESLGMLTKRKSDLLDIVYLFEQDEVMRFLLNYFKKNDVFRANIQKDDPNTSEQTRDSASVHDVGLRDDIYSDTFARNLRAQMKELEDSRAVISAKYKILFDEQLDRFERLKLRDFFLGGMLIEKSNLSTGVKNRLLESNMRTIKDIIEFSRSCDRALRKDIKWMGPEKYDEIRSYIESLGLRLEDMDKSATTKAHNDRLLNRISKVDAAKFAIYLEQIRWGIRSSIMQEGSKEELEERINTIKETYGIRISNEDLIDIITARIEQLDKRFYHDIPVTVLDLPSIVIKALKAHGIEKIREIYSLRDRDVTFFKKQYGAYFDLVVAELKRMGLEYSVSDDIPSTILRKSTYMNRVNIGFLMYLINEFDIDESKKRSLMEALLEKTAEYDKTDIRDVDKELEEKIEELREAYHTLEEREETLSELETNQNKTDTDQDDNLGDIV